MMPSCSGGGGGAGVVDDAAAVRRARTRPASCLTPSSKTSKSSFLPRSAMNWPAVSRTMTSVVTRSTRAADHAPCGGGSAGCAAGGCAAGSGGAEGGAGACASMAMPRRMDRDRGARAASGREKCRSHRLDYTDRSTGPRTASSGSIDGVDLRLTPGAGGLGRRPGAAPRPDRRRLEPAAAAAS